MEVTVSFPILSLLLGLPLLGAVLLMLLPKEEKGLLRAAATLSAGLSFVMSLVLVAYTGVPDPTRYEGLSAALPTVEFVERHDWIPALGASYLVGVDGLSVWLVVLATLLSLLGVVSSYSAVQERVKEYMICFMLLTTGMIGSLVALDAMLFYVFWEMMLIPVYFMIGMWGQGELRHRATLKFFLYTMFGSVLMLVALLYVYLQTHVGGAHSFALDAMLAAPISPDAQPWLLLAFVLAFGIKVPLFPVHTWLPDAYTSAPTSTTVLMAGLMGKVGAYALLRFAFPLFPEAAVTWAPLVGVLAVLGIGYGAMIAVVQKDIKRLVAYSSISHLGFVMLGIAALTTQGVDGAVYVMLAHGVSTGGLFLLVGMLEERRGTTQISEFGGLAKVVPGISALLMIFVLTSVGLPGLAGFVGEFLVLMGAANSDIFFVSQTHWLSDAVGVGPELGAFALTAMAAVGVILSAVYLLWMFQRVMFGPVVNPKNLDLKGLSPRELLYLAPLVALAFAMGLFPNFFLDKVRPSSEHFLSQLRPGIEAKTTEANPRALKRLDPGQVRRLTAELARERKREREAKVDAARQQREPKNDAKLPPGKMPTKPQDTAAVEKAKKVTRPEDLKLKPGTTLRLEKLFRGDKAEPKKEGEPSPNP